MLRTGNPGFIVLIAQLVDLQNEILHTNASQTASGSALIPGLIWQSFVPGLIEQNLSPDANQAQLVAAGEPHRRWLKNWPKLVERLGGWKKPQPVTGDGSWSLGVGRWGGGGGGARRIADSLKTDCS